MRVFKRVASLAMALCMSATLLTGFAFNDVSTDTNYNESISLLTSLGALKGYPDGSFGSDKDISREEFVKILYVLMTGSDNAGMYAGVSPFPDVAAERWSAAYINWAKHLGVVGGDPDGAFSPERPVSFAEASKMFVVAIGYDAKSMTFPYGFIDKAQTIGLFEDVAGVAFNVAAKRGAVAQMGSNCLFVEAPRFNVTNGNTTLSYTPAQKVFDIVDGEAVLTATSNYALSADGLVDAGQIKLDNGLVFDYAGNADQLLGSQLKVWYKDKKDDGLTADDLIINLQAAAKNRVYEFSAGDVKTSKTNASKVVFTIGGREISIDYSSLEGGIALADGSTVKLNEALFETLSAKSFTIVDHDGDNKAEAIYVREPVAARVNYYDAKSGKVMLSALLTGMTSIEDSDGNTVVELYDGMLKNDYVFVEARNSVIGGSVSSAYSVSKAEILEGVAMTSTNGDEFWFGGKQYDYIPTVALNTSLNGTVSATEAGKVPAFSMGNSYDLFLDPNGNIYRAEVSSATRTLTNMLVTGVTQSANGLGGFAGFALTGVLEDGTIKTLEVKLDDGAVVEGIFDENKGWADEAGRFYGEQGFDGDAIAVKHNLVRYSLDRDGAINSLSGIAALATGDSSAITGISPDQNAYTDVQFASKESSLKTSDGSRIGYVTEDSTVFIVNTDKNKVSVVKGDELPKFTAADHVDMVEGVSDSSKTLTWLVLAKNSALVSAEADISGLVTGITILPGETSSEVIYELTVAANGVIESYKTESMSASTAIWVDASGLKRPLSAALVSGGSAANTMLGYASIDVDGSGLVSEVRSLGKDASMSGTGSMSWGQGIVSRLLPSGFSLREEFVLDYKTGSAADLVSSVTDSDSALIFADDCVFYTIDGSVTGGDIVSAAYSKGDSVLLDRDADVAVADRGSLTASDNIGSENGVHYFVDYLAEMTTDGARVVAVFIYTETL